MTGGRKGDPVPPRIPGAAWQLRWGKSKASRAWKELRASGFSARLDWLARQLQEEPRWIGAQSRHHRLKGSLATRVVDGAVCEHWQHEISGGGRVWFAICDSTKTVHILKVSPGHPSQTG